MIYLILLLFGSQFFFSLHIKGLKSVKKNLKKTLEKSKYSSVQGWIQTQDL
jgi:hypothetical protein